MRYFGIWTRHTAAMSRMITCAGYSAEIMKKDRQLVGAAGLDIAHESGIV